ncbi:MAG: sigma 54-interacting transcriptional regulator [Acidobacteria bacterium]|nr:sigma 54-interacting transcriptional regulator [Acidobacteriota bacterium]
MTAAPQAGPEEHPAGDQHQALLDVSRAILAHRDLNGLFRDLWRLLGQVLRFDFLNLLLYDASLNAMRLHILETAEPFGSAVSKGPHALDVTPSGKAWLDQAPVIIEDVAGEPRWPFVMQLLGQRGISTACYYPLTTAHRRLGAIGFGFLSRHPITRAESEFIQNAIAPVAVAVDNALSQDELALERDRLRALLDISNALNANLRKPDLFITISATLRTVIPHDYASVTRPGPEPGTMVLKALDFPSGGGIIHQDITFPIEGSAAGRALAARRVLAFSRADLEALGSAAAQSMVREGLRSVLCAPLVTPNGVKGTLNLASFKDNAFSDADAAFLGQVATQVALAVENVAAYREISELRDRLAEEKLYLEDEIRNEQNFGEMVGESDAFKRVLKQIETVSPTPATVLILGETGTGKELVARAIHEWSTRKDRTFVKLNCAAIPTGLLESELFGHERGAFTGAIAQRIGRLELADKGTLFLDEIGDIPLELQPKLLRALQEHEFERLGSTRTQKVDVRLIAATNRDLTAMVANREFRADLYYRLNVFPIQVPALRDRVEDIPILVRHFSQKFARRMNRHIETIPTDVMNALVRYPWPGNVRELENLIERAVILSSGSTLRVPGLETGAAPAAASGQTLADAERDHIVRTLTESGWVLSGPNGAAARLGMKRTTLQSRMKKLGIVRE